MNGGKPPRAEDPEQALAGVADKAETLRVLTSERVVAREGFNGPTFSVDTAGTISEMTSGGRWIILAD